MYYQRSSTEFGKYQDEVLSGWLNIYILHKPKNMKFLTLLAVLPVTIMSLTEFASKDEMLRCIQTCEQHITPCIKDDKSQCFKVYHKCLESKDPFTCMNSVNSVFINKIAQCFDSKCQALEKKILDQQEKQDFEEMAQFTKPQGKDQADFRESLPVFHPPTPTKVDIPILIQGHVVKFDQHGEPINEIHRPVEPKEKKQEENKAEEKTEEEEIKESS